MEQIIEWDKVKYTPLLVNKHGDGINQLRTMVSINGYSIPISERGIELEWWGEGIIYKEEDLKMPIPEYLRDYIQLKEIHLMSGALLHHIFPNHNQKTMVFLEIYDYLRRRKLNMEIINTQRLKDDFNEKVNPTIEVQDEIVYTESTPLTEEAELLDNTLPEETMVDDLGEDVDLVEGQAPVNENTIEFASKGLPLLLWNTLLGKGEPSADMNNLEDCINKLMMTEHNDAEHISRMKKYTQLHKYGDPKNRSDLLYLQAKIIRFITLNPKDVFKCLDIVYIIPDDLCDVGLTGDSMKVLANLLDVDVSVDNKTQLKHTKTVYDLLVKYIPDVMKQIIDISEEYELNKCNGKAHVNTTMMKNIYKNLFINNNMTSFMMPDLGISDFFIDFKQNILTKVILLAFIAYVISKLVNLFKIQYNIQGN
jgi:hypothetical protein